MSHGMTGEMLGLRGGFAVPEGAALRGVGAGARAETLPVSLGLKRLSAFGALLFRHGDSISHTPWSVKGLNWVLTPYRVWCII